MRPLRNASLFRRILTGRVDLLRDCTTVRNSVEFPPMARHRAHTRMPGFGDRLIRPAVFVTVTLWTMAAPACNVPVFRYALERWAADPYEIVVFHREPLTAESQELLGALEKAGRAGLANLALRRANLADQMSQPLRALWNAQQEPVLPWMVVRYPRKLGIEQPVWAGPLNAEAVGTLLESPARRDIAQRLMRGDAVVWLLLESGDKNRDDPAGRLVEGECRKLEQTLELPELSPLDPQMNADLPLKIAFSMVRVARSDPAERMLVNLLLNWNTNLATATEVMLFPIFGRGRAVSPAIGEEIRPEAIREMAEFLTGPCACEVKAMNPGYDLLLAANWSALLDGREVRPAGLPPLIGMSQFAVAAKNHPAASPNPPAVALAAVSTPPAAVGQDHLIRNLAIVLGLGVGFLVVTTLVLRARGNRRLR